MSRILLLSDHAEAGVVRELEACGSTYLQVDSAQAAFSLMPAYQPMLTIVNGSAPLDECRKLLTLSREHLAGHTGVLLLFADVEESAAHALMQEGLDDWASPKEGSGALQEKCLRILHDTEPSADRVLFTYKGIALDKSFPRVYINREPVQLTTKQYSLLRLLLEHPHQTLSRLLIKEKIWGALGKVSMRTVDSYIASLRKLMKDEGHRIQTVFGKGYRLD